MVSTKNKKEKLPSRLKEFDDEVRLRPQPKMIETPRIEGIEKLINQELKEEKESKEIFKSEGIKTRTDLNDNEISAMSRLLFLCDTFEFNNLNKALHNFMELRLSRNRKSRKEFIDALKSNQVNNQFMPFNGGGQNANLFR